MSENTEDQEQAAEPAGREDAGRQRVSRVIRLMTRHWKITSVAVILALLAVLVVAFLPLSPREDVTRYARELQKEVESCFKDRGYLSLCTDEADGGSWSIRDTSADIKSSYVGDVSVSNGVITLTVRGVDSEGNEAEKAVPPCTVIYVPEVGILKSFTWKLDSRSTCWKD